MTRRLGGYGPPDFILCDSGPHYSPSEVQGKVGFTEDRGTKYSSMGESLLGGSSDL